MKTHIITALSIVAVLGTAGGAYAVNQTMLASATNETSIIGTATPVLVPIAPKGADIPAEYRAQLAEVENQKPTPAGGLVSSSTTANTGTAPAPSASSHDSDDDSDDSEDETELEYEDDENEQEDDD